MSVDEKLAELRAALNRHNHLYHVLDSPEITDSAYDELMNQLLALENRRCIPTRSQKIRRQIGLVGVPLSKFEKVIQETDVIAGQM